MIYYYHSEIQHLFFQKENDWGFSSFIPMAVSCHYNKRNVETIRLISFNKNHYIVISVSLYYKLYTNNKVFKKL